MRVDVKNTRVPRLVLLAAGLSAVTAGVVTMRALSPSRPGDPGPAVAAAQEPADPSFPTRAQASVYFTAKVEGERRALQVVEASLRQARAQAGNPQQIAKLEALRTDYQARLRRHEANLGAIKAADPAF